MHCRSRVLAAILAFVVALAAFAASAQTPESTSLPAAASLAGIEAAVVRTWVIDVEFELDVTPEPVPATVPDVPGASIFQFDSSENAAAAWTKYADSIGDYMLALGSWDEPTLTTAETPGLGDQVISISLGAAIGDNREVFRFTIVQDETRLIVTAAVGGDPAGMEAANALAKWIVDEGVPGDDDVIFDDAGASSGGPRAHLPPNDHELLEGLGPINDETLYPDSSPESEDAVG